MSATELVDIVDEADVVIKQAPRAEMRRHCLRHRSVYILVINSKQEIFIHRRTQTKDVYPGYWDVTVGGVVAAGEGYEAGARRELSEELGFESVELQRLFPVRYEDVEARVNGMAYLCRSEQLPRLQADEIDVGAWVDLVDIRRFSKVQRFCPDGLAVFEQYRALSG